MIVSGKPEAICGTAEVERLAQRLRSRPADIQYQRRLPIGAEWISAPVGTHFRVWAPTNHTCAVEFYEEPDGQPLATVPLQAEEHGYFSGIVSEARPGTLYRFRIEQGSFPDPASRFQPVGPHGPSQVVDPHRFEWHDEQWRGVRREGQVIYEMHIGTFTPEGTWRAAIGQLPELARLGITVIELMPVADFPGRFGWGYDGVNLFAPTRLYGTPDDLRAFVDAAHREGLGVILDVVYNHLGPDGNYLPSFSPCYFTDKHDCEWGDAINFDGEGSGPVREFFVSNARYWIDEYHMDGLRLDATQQIYDDSERHVIAEIVDAARAAASQRSVYIVGENEPQHTILVRGGKDGYGVDALWNDDFHHTAVVAATGRREAYYTDYKGSPQEFISAAKWGYLYQGQWYDWQEARRGTPSLDLEPTNFVTFTQNHDQVANSLRGKRLHELTSPGRYRALTALLLLGPGTPMLFQGQEFAASTPFLYFADHKPELAAMVSKGRRQFLNQFKSMASKECDAVIHAPESEEAFRQCVLNFQEREQHAAIYSLHRDLLRLRREDPVFSRIRRGSFDGAVLGPEAFVLRFFGGDAGDRLLIVNLGVDLHLSPAPEPLLAPPGGKQWQILLSTASVCYGGEGTGEITMRGNWLLPAHTVLAMAAANQGNEHAESLAQNRSNTP
jgi:maltooligosyltrehalose trehalohydrolase